MNRLSQFLGGVLVFLSGSVSGAPLFPRVVTWSGQVQIMGHLEKKIQLQKKMVLTQQARVMTGPRSFLRVELSAGEFVVLGPESQMFFPLIDFDSGHLNQIQLEKGSLRLVNLGASPRQVVTPLSKDSYAQVDAIFRWFEQKAQTEVTVVEGELSFRGTKMKSQV